MQTIFLEFQHENGALAANGTDVTFYIDGRWRRDTTEKKIRARVSALRQVPGSKYGKQLFVGYTKSGSDTLVPMRDTNPPVWKFKIDAVPHNVSNPWNSKNIECRNCGHDEFYDAGRSLDRFNWLCANCDTINHTMTETGMSA